MTGALVPAVVAGAFFLLGRWGLGNASELVPAVATPERREREERRIRRGAKSAVWMAVLFATFAVISAVSELTDGHTPQ